MRSEVAITEGDFRFGSAHFTGLSVKVDRPQFSDSIVRVAVRREDRIADPEGLVASWVITAKEPTLVMTFPLADPVSRALLVVEVLHFTDLRTRPTSSMPSFAA
jgi:hypothetical protein